MSLDVTLYVEADTGGTELIAFEVYSSNITHNLSKMAEEAGIYKALWRPEEINATTAKDITSLLETGLEKLKNDPKHYETFNSPNGWGTYKYFVPFVENYLEACKLHPKAKISTWR